jgi:hypothetical protein
MKGFLVIPVDVGAYLALANIDFYILLESVLKAGDHTLCIFPVELVALTTVTPADFVVTHGAEEKDRWIERDVGIL